MKSVQSDMITKVSGTPNYDGNKPTVNVLENIIGQAQVLFLSSRWQQRPTENQNMQVDFIFML